MGKPTKYLFAILALVLTVGAAFALRQMQGPANAPPASIWDVGSDDDPEGREPGAKRRLPTIVAPQDNTLAPGTTDSTSPATNGGWTGISGESVSPALESDQSNASPKSLTPQLDRLSPIPAPPIDRIAPESLHPLTRSPGDPLY